MRSPNKANLCSECEQPRASDVRVLQFTVYTNDEKITSFDYDDLTYAQMIRILDQTVNELRAMTEPPSRCKTCGKRGITKT